MDQGQCMLVQRSAFEGGGLVAHPCRHVWIRCHIVDLNSKLNKHQVRIQSKCLPAGIQFQQLRGRISKLVSVTPPNHLTSFLGPYFPKQLVVHPHDRSKVIQRRIIIRPDPHFAAYQSGRRGCCGRTDFV